MQISSRKQLISLLVIFVIVKVIGISTFDRVHRYYHHEMIVNHYAIAHAMWNGHFNLMFDSVLRDNMMEYSEKIGRNVQLEEIESIPASGEYKRFPLTDLPGYAFIIYTTSKLMHPIFKTGLTARYSFFIQILAEFAFVFFMFVFLNRFFGSYSGFWFGVIYLVGFPFTHIFTNQPFRDGFMLTGYASVFAAFAYFFEKEGKLNTWEKNILVFGLIFFSALLLWVRPYGLPLLAVLCFCPFLIEFRNRKWNYSQRFRLFLFSALIVMGVFWLPYKAYREKYYGKEMGPFISTGLWQGLAEAKDNRFEFQYGDRDLLKWARVKLNDPDLLYNDVRLRALALEYSIEALKIDWTLFPRSCWNRFLRLLNNPLDLDPIYILPYFGESKMTKWEFFRRYPEAVIHKAVKQYGYLFFYFNIFIGAGLLMYWGVKREFQSALLFLIGLSPFIFHLLVAVFHIYAARHFFGGAWALCIPFAIVGNTFMEKCLSLKIESIKKIVISPNFGRVGKN